MLVKRAVDSRCCRYASPLATCSIVLVRTRYDAVTTRSGAVYVTQDRKVLSGPPKGPH